MGHDQSSYAWLYFIGYSNLVINVWYELVFVMKMYYSFKTSISCRAFEGSYHHNMCENVKDAYIEYWVLQER